MLLEAFFSTVASNVFTEIFKQVTDRKRKEKDIEEIVDRVLRNYPSLRQSSVIEKEIIMILGNAGPVETRGQLRSLPHRISDPSQLLREWWDKRVYKIVSLYTEKALDAPRDGTSILLWDYHGEANQQWKVIPVGDQDNLFKIHSCYSSMVLDLPEPRMDDGTQIIQWGYYGTTNQQWRLIPIDRNGEIFKITSEWSGKSLDAPNTRTDNGAPLIQWGDHGGTNQQWRLMRVE